MTAIFPEAAVDNNKGRKREPHHCNQHQKGQLHHDLERSIAGRMTEERWRKRVEESEERTKEGRGDGWREQPGASSTLESDRTMEERHVRTTDGRRDRA